MLTTDRLTPGTLVRHYKGGTYVITGAAQDTESGERLILYRRADQPGGTLWARPAKMFQESITTPAGRVSRFKLLASDSQPPPEGARQLDVKVAAAVFDLQPALRPCRHREDGTYHFPADDAVNPHDGDGAREWAVPAEVAPDGAVLAWRPLLAYSSNLKTTWRVMQRIWQTNPDIVFFPDAIEAENRFGYSMWVVSFNGDETMTHLGFADTFPLLACQLALQLYASEEESES